LDADRQRTVAPLAMHEVPTQKVHFQCHRKNDSLRLIAAWRFS
jgi:hypothetical protein